MVHDEGSDIDNTAIQSDIEEPSNTRSRRYKRGSATRGTVARQNYRPITSHNTAISDDPGSRRATILENVREGLIRKSRRARDPNKINIEFPPDFSRLAMDERDHQSESLHQPEAFYQSSSRSMTVGTSAKPAALSLTTINSSSITHHSTISFSPMSMLGAGRVDPFANYPIQVNKPEEWLIDQMNTGQDPAFKTLRDCWFPVAIRYPACFHQFLANLALNVSRAHGGANHDAISVNHHSHAVQLVNNELRDSALNTKDDIVAAVVTFISYSILTGDFESWTVHMEGLESVVRARGGYETLENDLMLSRLIFCVDISGASRQDLKPRFPHPAKMLQDARESANNLELSPLSSQSLVSWGQWFSPSHILNSVLEDLRLAIQQTETRRSQQQEWRRVTFIIHWIDPVMHRLLNMDQNVNRKDSASVIQEACRLGILLFLAEVRRKCGVMCVSTKVYSHKLKDLLSETDDHVEWKPFDTLRLWVLFFGMLESWQQPEANWYVESFSVVAERLQIAPWENIFMAVKSVLWFDDIFDKDIEKFRAPVMSRLLNSGAETDTEI